MIYIFPIDETYLTELVWLSRQTFSDAFEAQTDPENYAIYVDNNLNEEVLRGELQSNTTQFFWARDAQGATVGYLKLRWDRSADFFGEIPALELQRIYLLGKYWNKSYGKILLEFAKNWAKQQQFQWIWLIVWFKNEGAIRFYEREGWEIFGRKDFQFGNEIHHDYVFRIKI